MVTMSVYLFMSAADLIERKWKEVPLEQGLTNCGPLAKAGPWPVL